MAELTKYFNNEQIRRAKQMCEDAKGKRVTVRLDRSTTVTGIVDAAEPSYAGFTGRSVHCVFSVDLLCGANQTRRNFKLRTLPR